MPFHVEVRSPHQHARVFNLGEGELGQILKLWVADQTFEFGEQEWEPRESKLTVLEGKTLEGPDLAFGQGWSNALRSAEDVTRRTVEAEEVRAPLVPVVAVEGDSVEGAAASIASGVGPVALEWSEARARIDGRDPSVAAVILVLRPSEAEQSRS
jgi:GH24 family phage-related lysozyme (muramidase)